MFPPKADVVVIGASVIGASICYHLSKRRMDVVVLEKGDLVPEVRARVAVPFFYKRKVRELP